MISDGMHSAQFMGLINALRTGDPVVDMVLAFVLPLLVQKVVVYLPAELKKIFRHLFGKIKVRDQQFNRSIIYRSTQQGGCNVDSDGDTFNMYLMRAIHLYVHRHCKLEELEDAHLDLTLLDTSNVSSRNGRLQMNNSHNNGSPNSTVDMLQMCSMVEKPLENKWLVVGNYDGGDVEIMICDSVVSGGKKNEQGGSEGGAGGGPGGGESKSSTRSLEVKLKSSKSVDSIRAFVKCTFDWYMDEIRKLENKDRFMLDVQPMIQTRSGGVPQYIAYKLGDEKTFATLFNRKAHDLLRIVDQFENKTGKYAIKGYPYKLGLLLSGIPGTGKTR